MPFENNLLSIEYHVRRVKTDNIGSCAYLDPLGVNIKIMSNGGKVVSRIISWNEIASGNAPFGRNIVKSMMMELDA